MAVDPAIVLAVLLTLPQYVPDSKTDTAAQRAELYGPVAQAIAEVSLNWTEAAALSSLAYNETRLARYVLEGRCQDGPKGARCDWDYLRRQPRALGPFQVHGWCRAAWATPPGAEQHLRAAECAVKLLRSSRTRCKRGLAGAFAGYAGRCDWPHTAARVTLTGALEGKMRRAARDKQ